VTHLGDAKRIRAVMLGGRPITAQTRNVDPGRISDFSQQYWSDLYTRDRVAELFPNKPVRMPSSVH
jgi:hypothetical protein